MEEQVDPEISHGQQNEVTEDPCGPVGRMEVEGMGAGKDSAGTSPGRSISISAAPELAHRAFQLGNPLLSSVVPGCAPSISACCSQDCSASGVNIRLAGHPGDLPVPPLPVPLPDLDRAAPRGTSAVPP